jgi:hypothetical protein
VPRLVLDVDEQWCYHPAVSDSGRQSRAKKGKNEDVALICGRSEDGGSLSILRKRADRLELGTVQPLRQGKAIHGEVVRLIPREGMPLLCDVEVEWAGNQGASAGDSRAGDSQAGDSRAGNSSGNRPSVGVRRPAQVATDTYRRNWDTIWQRRRTNSTDVN